MRDVITNWSNSTPREVARVLKTLEVSTSPASKMFPPSSKNSKIWEVLIDLRSIAGYYCFCRLISMSLPLSEVQKRIR